MQRYQKQVAIITGGGTGIGAAVAERQAGESGHGWLRRGLACPV